MTLSDGEVYEFGDFRLSSSERQLYCAGESVPLTAKVFDLLALLVRNRGRALGKSELMHALWPEVTVEENNLTVHVSALRKVLRDHSRCPKWIERGQPSNPFWNERDSSTIATSSAAL